MIIIISLSSSTRVPEKNVKRVTKFVHDVIKSNHFKVMWSLQLDNYIIQI